MNFHILYSLYSLIITSYTEIGIISGGGVGIPWEFVTKWANRFNPTLPDIEEVLCKCFFFLSILKHNGYSHVFISKSGRNSQREFFTNFWEKLTQPPYVSYRYGWRSPLWQVIFVFHPRTSYVPVTSASLLRVRVISDGVGHRGTLLVLHPSIYPLR